MGMFDVSKANEAKTNRQDIAQAILETLQQAAPEFAQAALQINKEPDFLIPKANNAMFFRGLRSTFGKNYACWYMGIAVECEYTGGFDSEVVITDEGTLCRIKHNELFRDGLLHPSVEPLGSRTDFTPDVLKSFSTPDHAKLGTKRILQKILET